MARRTSVLIFLLLFSTFFVAAQSVPCGQWQTVEPPIVDGVRLRAVAAYASDAAWAVGTIADANGQTLNVTARWDGSAWTNVPTPSLPGGSNVLSGVAMVAADDVWAVGAAPDPNSPTSAGLALHWNGTAWSVVPLPAVSGGSYLNAVTALASDDVWAVGLRAGGLPDFTATTVPWIVHWDGDSWKEAAAPYLGNRSNVLQGIAAISAQDIWAVGYYRDIGGFYQNLVVRYDGTDWKLVATPVLASENELYSVAAAGAQQVMAVGYRNDGVLPMTFALHWDDLAMQEKPLPGDVGGVAAFGPSDFWAVGADIMHFDGERWSLVPDPVPPGGAVLNLLAVTPTGASCEGWAVGRTIGMDGMERAAIVRLRPGSATLNQPPVAVAGAAPKSGSSPLTVQFNSTASHDPDGSIVKHEWEFGDSPSVVSTEPNPTHTYVYIAPGTFHARLKVTDDQGGTATASVTIQITEVLTVNRDGTGTGSVVSAPSGIECGSVCSAEFARGATVTLTAGAANGSSFTGWSGACSGSGACSVTMDVAKHVVATFALLQPFDFGPAPAMQTITAGQAAQFTLNLYTQTAFTGTVSFACSAGLPQGAACAFNPATATISGTGASTLLTVTTTPRTTAVLRPPLGLFASFFAGMVLIPFVKPSPRRLLAFLFLLLVLALSLTACGGGSGAATKVNSTTTNVLGTPSGTHVITVTATSGSIVRAQNVTVVVN